MRVWLEQVNFFYRESKSKKKNYFFLGGGGGDGEGGLMDGYTNRPKPICPFNFFEVGGITMHKCKCQWQAQFITILSFDLQV